MAELKSGEVGRHLTTMPLSENLDLSKTKRRHGKVLSRKRTSTDLLLEKDLGIKGEREEVIWEKKRKIDQLLQNHFRIHVVLTLQVNDELSSCDQHSPHPKEDTLGPSGMHTKGGALTVCSEVTMISSKLGPSKYLPSEQPGELLHVSIMEHCIALNMTNIMDEIQAHIGKWTSKIK